MATYLDIPASLAFLQSARPSFRSLEGAIGYGPVVGYARTTQLETQFHSHVPDFSLAERVVRHDLALPGVPGGPVGIIVPRAGDRRVSSLRRASVWSGVVPPGSFVAIEKGVYACSPGFCFLRLAHVLSPVEHVKLGLCLCGCFPLVDGIKPPYSPTFWAPVTSAALLGSYLDEARGAYGVKLARRTLPHVLDDAASMRECEMAMCVHLPLRMGGYGVRDVILNDVVPASARARRVSEMSHFVLDLHIPSIRVAMEYDSELGHSDSRAHARDAARRGGIENMGIHVVTVTNEQLKSQWGMDRVMADVAQTGKIHFAPRGYDHIGRRIRLHQELFGMA